MTLFTVALSKSWSKWPCQNLGQSGIVKMNPENVYQRRLSFEPLSNLRNLAAIGVEVWVLCLLTKKTLFATNT